MIYYEHSFERGPLMCCLRLMAEKAGFRIKFRKKHQQIPVEPQQPEKERQYVIYDYSNGKQIIADAVRFLQINKFCTQQPRVATQTHSKGTRITWELPKDVDRNEFKAIFQFIVLSLLLKLL